MKLNPWRIAWGTLLGIGGLFELEALLNPAKSDTFSEFTRWAFHTDTTAGAWVFGVSWASFAGWYLWHIISGRKHE